MSSNCPKPEWRRTLARALVLGGGLAMLAAPVSALARKAAKKPPALYTAAQAATGQALYGGECAVCHGATLEGRVAPALRGAQFANAKSDFAIADVFLVIAQQMPAGKPGSLPQADYAAIMAYLLQQNGYPAGSKLLTYEEASTSNVALIYSGP